MELSGKKLITKAFKLESTNRIPWVPFVGCHGGKLINVTATEYLQSANNIVKGISRAVELYQPDGIPVVFDLQVEAEILGCELLWSDENPPAVVSHILSEGKSLSELAIPKPEDGRIPVVTDAIRKIRTKFPDLALYGLVTGPFTLALHLMGTDIFLKMYEDPDEVIKVMDFCTKVTLAMSDYYIQAGSDVIAVVDPMTSQIDPGSFETFVSPHASRIFDFIRSENTLSSFFVCGHAQQNIAAMCDCKPDNVSVDENIPLDYVKEIALKKRISFGGNLHLTVVLLMGTEEESQKHALECMDVGGQAGFILAPGCDLPMATPEENLVAVGKVIHDPYIRDVVRTLEHTEKHLDLLNMKDYGLGDKVIVDIITLDSESCAPCQYMVEAVRKVTPHFEGIVEWREHPIKKMESVSFMSSLMVKNIPTICIDGKISFVSQIPPRDQLIAAIQKRINEKFKIKIRSKKGEILIFGKNIDECRGLKKEINIAMQELGKDIEVREITDINLTASYGISVTPAVVIAQYKLKSQGEMPSLEIIKEWLKEI